MNFNNATIVVFSIASSFGVRRCYLIGLVVLFFISDISFAFSSDDEYVRERVSELHKVQPDSLKVDSLIRFLQEIRTAYPEDAINISWECIELSEKRGFTKRYIDSYLQLSSVYILNHKFDSANLYLDLAIDLADSLKQYFLLAKAYRFKSIVLNREGYQNTALNYLRKSVRVLGNRDSAYLAKIYNNIGAVYYKLGQYDSSAYFYITGFNILKRNKIMQKAYLQLINLAEVFYRLKEYGKAKYFLFESLKLIKNGENTFNTKKNTGLIYNKLGGVYYKENNIDSSLYYYRLCERYYKAIDVNLSNLYLNLGALFKDIGNVDSALFYYNLSRNCSFENNNGSVYNNISVVYMDQGEYNIALKYIDTAIAKTIEAGELENLILYYDNKQEIYRGLGNYKNALKYLQMSKDISDSVLNIKKAKMISDFEMKYEREKDQAHILSLKNENLRKNLELNKRTNQRNIFLAGGSGILVISILIFAFYRQKVKKDKIIADQRIEKLEREKKLLAAKSIVEGQEEERKRIARELHDGLGVLLSTAKMQFKSIADKSPENSEMIKKAAGLLEKASSDVRRISHNMMPGILTKLGLDEALDDLFENLNDTQEIEAVLKIENRDDIRLPENSEIMIYRIVQEMVNNTLKYAEASKVTLDMSYEEKSVFIQYSDNGKGFNVEEKMKNKSIGLTSIQSRVNFLGGKININSKPGRGTTYFINVPV